MRRLAAFERAWEECPPLRRMVAAFIGIKPKKRAKNFDELLSLFPDGTIKG